AAPTTTTTAAPTTTTTEAPPEGPAVMITAPADGSTVSGEVTVQLAVQDFTLEPAGLAQDGYGHLHLMIDTDCVDVGSTVPRDDQHIHLGDGSSSRTLDLAPGEHTICAQAGDGIHRALDLTDTVTFTVDP
ncbi:MAG: DUF4399 domain-containing protein, partial [Actinomycetota bacterium]|nr:DUF4399 domain-containing protein [Actinomycetota bacterium]